MKTIKATATEAKILDAIKAAKARGLRIVDGGWNVKWDEDAAKFVPEGDCCCPLGAVLLASDDMPPNVVDLHDGDDDHEKLALAAAAILDKPYGWCNKFTEAFDAPDNSTGRSCDKAALKIRELLFDENHGITK